MEAGLTLTSVLLGIPGVEIAVFLANSFGLRKRYAAATGDVGLNLRVGPGTFRNPHLVGEAILGHAFECMGGVVCSSMGRRRAAKYRSNDGDASPGTSLGCNGGKLRLALDTHKTQIVNIANRLTTL